jgi:gliding motility-associated-like protein
MSMRKSLLILFCLFCLLNKSFADHIKGGFFTYQYLGPGTNNPNNNMYRVTLTVYMICNPSVGQLNNPINFSLFNAATGSFIQNYSVSIANRYQLAKVRDEECITGDQRGCYYEIVVYDLPSVELAPTPGGYTFAYQRCCRLAGIANLVAPSSATGNTFEITIPGTSLGQTIPQNSSPAFAVNDTAVVCSNSHFEHSFSAVDPDAGDSLSYEFCNALAGASQTNSAPGTAASPNTYSSVPYSAPYNGSMPMGFDVSIDPVTGIISGQAPATGGEYVVSVCVNEFKDGVLISRTRKELHVRVGDCEPIRAELDPQYITCDGFTQNFSNNANGTGVTSWYWDFGVTTAIDDTSILAAPSFTYPDTGIYIVKLVVNRGQLCSATDSAIVKVYPGFFPGFTSAGICYLNPVQFTDTSRTVYGVVDSWSWNFGDGTTLGDTSHNQNPSWTYTGPGPKTVTLTVTNSKGCTKSTTQNVDLLDKPPLSVAFKDTLMCILDNVQLQATGVGNFSWSPAINIVNANTATPTVNPPATTTYTVELENGGCRATDTVRVRVISVVSVNVRPDTTICLTDAIQLNAVTDGLTYAWTTTPAGAAGTLNNTTILNPIATPIDANTTYHLQSSVGSCASSDQVTIRAVPYPVANAGLDTTICYNTAAQLSGSHNGISFTWSPINYLNNPNILNPVASPPRTTSFILSAFADAGCPKPGHDTVLVTMLPRIQPYAGRDTSVIVGQPLQLNASGGVSYIWSPPFGLNNTTIPNPVGLYDANVDSVRYKVEVFNILGCSDSAFIKVKVFKTSPSIFVPSAFTPNNDGRNDLIRPIAVGIQKINYFSIYNRWGQRVFTTSVNGHGWDGRIGGTPQATNTFVWMVSAVDYLGKPYFQKGTVTLIR